MSSKSTLGSAALLFLAMLMLNGALRQVLAGHGLGNYLRWSVSL